MQVEEYPDIEFFNRYLKITGIPTYHDKVPEKSKLCGKKIGIINGSSWILLWVNYYANKYLPGVTRINIGN